MVITAITLENFKGIKGPCRIKLRPLTMLFGANSAGKSTVVQALHYAREIFMRQNTDPDKTLLGGSMDLGGFSNLVYKHDLSLPIKITFDLDLSADPLPDYYEEDDNKLWAWEQSELKEAVGKVESASVGIAVQVIKEDSLNPMAGKAAVTEYSVMVNGEHLASLNFLPGKELVYLSLNPFNSIYWDNKEDRAAFEREIDAVLEGQDYEGVYEGALNNLTKWWALTPDDLDNEIIDHYSYRKILRDMKSPLPQWERILPVSKSFESDIQMEDFSAAIEATHILSSCLTSLITGPGEMVRNDLEKMCYLGPIREVPERNYVEVKSPDPSRWSNGLAAWDALYNQGEALIKDTNQWLTSDERLDSGYRLEMEIFRRINENGRLMAALRSGRSLDDYQEELNDILAQRPEKRLYLVEEAKNIKVMPQDIGVGISQVLPVVVASLVTRNSILSIEQPELHIHPKLQVGLGDLFIHESTTKGNCFIIETHSEHLMLRIMRRIKEAVEGDLPPGHPILRPEDIAVYHVESREEGTVFYEIRIDDDGNFRDRWPEGFFEERDGEL